MSHFHITASSRVGCVRTNNEDMILVKESFLRNGKDHYELDTDEKKMLIALADGMGGHNCGEVASSDVLHNLRYYFSDLPDNLSTKAFPDAIYGWLTSICRTIDTKGHSDPMYLNMGTTLVSLVHIGGEFYWMNCGDSRFYRLHDGVLTQLTTDHSLSQMMGSKEHSSLIVNCIGGGCKESYIDIEKCTDQIEVGDVLLLCSDGLTDMVDDETIKGQLAAGFDADALCQLADDAGGYDNVSVIVIHVEE
jgi:protein phosphatase